MHQQPLRRVRDQSRNSGESRRRAGPTSYGAFACFLPCVGARHAEPNYKYQAKPKGLAWIKIIASVPMLSTRTRSQRISFGESSSPVGTLQAGSDTGAHHHCHERRKHYIREKKFKTMKLYFTGSAPPLSTPYLPQVLRAFLCWYNAHSGSLPILRLLSIL